MAHYFYEFLSVSIYYFWLYQGPDLGKSRWVLEFFRSDLVLPKPDCYIIYDVRNEADAFYNFFIPLVSWKICSIKKAVSRFTRNCLNIFMDN